MQKRSQGFSHLLAIFLIVILLSFGSFAYLKYQERASRINVNDPFTMEERNADSIVIKGIRVDGNMVYNGTRPLISNLEDVSEVILDKDNHTLHFIKPDSTEGAKCIDLNDTYFRANYNLMNATDYSEIGRGYIRDCSYRYLRNFPTIKATLTISSDKKGKIIMDDWKNGDSKEFPLPPKLVNEVLDYKTKYESEIDTSDENTILYSHADSFEYNHKQLLAYGPLIIEIDTQKNQVIGSVQVTKPKFQVIENSYWFEHKPGKPIVVVDSGWEGPWRYQALIDLSNSLNTVSIRDLDHSGFIHGHEDALTWGADGVAVTLSNEDLVSKEVQDIIDSVKDFPDDTQKIQTANKKDEARLKETNKYKEVECDLGPGYYGPGCFVVNSTDKYEFTAGSSAVTKLQ